MGDRRCRALCGLHYGGDGQPGEWRSRGEGGEAAGDTFVSIEQISGSAFNDTLIGDAGDNRLLGNNGDDVLEGGDGADVLDGGNGVDRATYANATSAISQNFATNVHTGEAAGDTFVSIEALLGSSYADILNGGIGTDLASYTGAASGVNLNFARGVYTGDAAGDVVANYVYDRFAERPNLDVVYEAKLAALVDRRRSLRIRQADGGELAGRRFID